MPVPPPPPPEPPVVLDAPAPMAAESALPAPPVAPAPAARAAAPAAVNSAAPAPPARKAAPPAARTAESDTGFDAAAAADAAAGDEPPEDVPPATADAPAVREAWLQRIRELLASGQTDAARASLKEFVRRHPDAPLPDDLRALAR
ncbi:MAG: tetratricopeptide repeat protein [Lysobacteraceae bacterium]